MSIRHSRERFSEAQVGAISQIEGMFIEELKMTPELARVAAELAMEAFRDHFQGDTVYMAKGHLYAITEKHRRIHRQLKGGASPERLAREYDLTVRQIYAIKAMLEGEEFEQKQGKLFG